MPKPKRIQRPNDMGAKALEDYGEVERRRAREESATERAHLAEDVRRVAVRQGWSITETKEELDGHV